MENKDTVYECLECSEKEIVKSYDPRKDGRVCKQCGGHLSPMGYVTIGIDLAKGNDYTFVNGEVVENK